MNVTFALFFALSLLLAPSTRARTRPHILFLLADDLGWSDVGYHNNSTLLKTPNIDGLARNGVILDNYYVQPTCAPTTSALLTGRYPIHTGNVEPYGLPLNLTLLPQKLKEVGYSTHLIGKWHLGFYEWAYTPTYRGFDTFYGFYNGAEDHWNHQIGGVLDLRDQTTLVTNRTDEYSDNIFTERAIQIITNADPVTPMFLFLSFQSVHAPNQPPERFASKYSYLYDWHRRTHLEMLSSLDEAVGNITDTLKWKGIWNDTLIIFSTDNGGMPLHGGYNWPLRGCKTTLWEGGVRGAGFVHGSMLKSKPRQCLKLLHVTDWFPTILGLAGVKDLSPSLSLDGYNVWETISTGAPSPRQEILLNMDFPENDTAEQEIAGAPPCHIPGKGVALRSGNMKLMLNVPKCGWFKPPEMGGKGIKEKRLMSSAEKRVKVALYNITADPEERHDLSASNQAIVARLCKRVSYYMNNNNIPSGKSPPNANKLAYETAKKKGYWGPWKSTEED